MQAKILSDQLVELNDRRELSKRQIDGPVTFCLNPNGSHKVSALMVHL